MENTSNLQNNCCFNEIIGLQTFTRGYPQALVHNSPVYKDFQSVLFVPTVMVASIYKGDPCEWMTSSSPLIGQKRGGSHVHSSSFFVWFGDYGFSSFGFFNLIQYE